MEIEVKVKFEHTRKIDENDKYYIVEVILDNEHKWTIGWIEKSFIEEDFIKRTKNAFNVRKVDVVKHDEFTNFEQYKKHSPWWK